MMNKGMKALKKEAPEVAKKMGYMYGGMAKKKVMGMMKGGMAKKKMGYADQHVPLRRVSHEVLPQLPGCARS
jgi:hypothetical protein